MSFWPSEMLTERAPQEGLIDPFDVKQVKHGAYQLRLGPEYYLTSDDPQNKRTLIDGSQVAIPSGQFALLLTLERVKVPPDSLAFISIRARYKLRGLVNVSGFHVDPGFDGRLKFGVYNAGADQVVLDAGAPVFSVWFCKFTSPTKDVYEGDWNNQEQLSADDVMRLQGKVSSPGELRRELDALRTDVTVHRTRVKMGVAILTPILVWLLTQSLIRPQPTLVLPARVDVPPAVDCGPGAPPPKKCSDSHSDQS